MSRAAASPPELRGFTYVKVLGSGGFSDVFLYDQHLPRRRVAVKVLLTEGLTAASREAFVAEANVMAQLSAHPYIVSIHHADVADDGRPYFIMEYCSGASLADRYKQQPLSVVETLRTGVRLSSAIATAHQAGILHRDIKPANVLTNDYGWPALTDFGISSAVEDSELPLHTTTRPVSDSGATTGSQSVGMSIPWSPPEMFDENPRPDVRSDVFSLAATLYTLLHGRTPFEQAGRANGALDLMGRIERGDITPMNRNDIPASFLAVLQRGMAVSRTDRFATAVDFARALQRVEMELDYAPTTIDVPNLVVPAHPVERRDDDDATRARSVRSISAQTAPAAAPPISTPTEQEEPSTVAEPQVVDATVMRGATPAETVVRSTPRAAPPDVSAHEAEPPRARSRRIPVIVGIVLLAGAVAVLLPSLLGGMLAPSAPDTTVAQQPDERADDEVIGTAVVQPTLVEAVPQPDGSILFSWEPAEGSQPDSYRWEQISGGDAAGAPGVATNASLPASASGAPVCIHVWSIEQGAQSVVPLEACAP